MQYEAVSRPKLLRWLHPGTLGAPIASRNKDALTALIGGLRRWFGRFRAGEGTSGIGQSHANLLPSSRRPRIVEGRPVSFALQGGGAHGAFTWGVLERLLEEPKLRIDAASGASAGALNAVALAAGFAEGGPAGARAKLEELWRAIVRLGRLNPLRPTALERLTHGWNADGALSQVFLDLVSRLVSPYQINPLGLDPLREMLIKLIDFDALREPHAIRLFIAATRIESGAGRIFTNEELSPEVVMASACLPTVHQAIRLDDGHYWDGGFSANPPLLPLIEKSEAADLILVRINPAHEARLPVTASEIQARVNRIMFEAPLKRELDVLAHLRRNFAAAGVTETPLARRLAALRLHEISADDVMRTLGASSKLHPDFDLVRYLKGVGREAAERWIADAGQSPRGARPANDNRLDAAV